VRSSATLANFIIIILLASFLKDVVRVLSGTGID
jgi:hypothetical protein